MRQHHILPAPQIRLARSQLMENGTTSVQGLDLGVSRSWHRSLAAGLSPVGRISAIDNLSSFELQRMRSLNHDLISHSQPVMEYLLDQVSNTQSMVILSDHQGVLMHTMGDLAFLTKAERVALMCGASWHETQRGTNAIGTALAEMCDVEIHGGEHFLERNGFLTCAAAPIMSASGALMGALDISGDHRSRHPHTLGLVSTAARMIENSLVQATSRDNVLLMLHARPEGIGTIAQGLLVFSHDGWLIGANRRGLEQMHLKPAQIGASTWAQLFQSEWVDLLERESRTSERAFSLQTQTHHTLFARVRGRSQTRIHSPAAQASTQAIRSLDTGDAKWRLAAEKALKVCDKDIPILVMGESGVGKEVFARAIHQSSMRSDKPFVALNCAAIPEHLIESELFGYVPGAFTGASKNGSEGRFREVKGGTLFLDEIGDMPLGLQTRLLRVLQEKRVTPVGSGESVAVDFSLICATHQQLKQAAEQGRFRTDLFYRINGLSLQLPALRDRQDFEALTQRLLASLGGADGCEIDPDLFKAMSAYPWPGNLRQLSHMLKTALALLEPHQTRIGWQHMPDDLVEELRHLEAQHPPHSQRTPQNLDELSMKAIQMALESCRGNVSAAAKQLGISRQTLYRRLKQK
jgi:sigma-54 dependent transcriptional regulator, acetoin dehydrogenase operon transcriptional activator AcoR